MGLPVTNLESKRKVGKPKEEICLYKLEYLLFG